MSRRQQVTHVLRPHRSLANAIFDYIEIFHNRQRRHSALNYRTPIEYELLVHGVRHRITGDHLIEELDRVAAERGSHPAVLRCDNGPELACGAMADWTTNRVPPHQGSAARSGDSLTCPTCWVPVVVAN